MNTPRPSLFESRSLQNAVKLARMISLFKMILFNKYSGFKILSDISLTLLVLCICLPLYIGSGHEAALGVPGCSFSSFGDTRLWKLFDSSIVLSVSKCPKK